MEQSFTSSAKTKKIIPLSLGAMIITMGMGSLQARTINADAGPIFNQFFANIQCERAAAKLKGKWNGRYWTKPGTINGVCQVVVADPVPPKPAKKPPIKPAVNLLTVDAGKLWNEAHANTRCPQLAKENNGRWTGKWSDKTANKPSYCQIEVIVKPTISKPTHKYINVKAGRIWSSEHANKRCKKLAKKNNGTWTGKWSTKHDKSTCQVKVAIAPKPAIPPVKPSPTPATGGNIREVAAGPIWDQAQAAGKCPLIASKSGSIWTGKWRKLDYSTHQSVCEVRSGATASVPTKTVVTTTTTYVNLKPDNPAPRNVREIFAGPIWDGNQAKVKCPLIAANNKGTWTGKWRKTGPDHSSLCEVSF